VRDRKFLAEETGQKVNWSVKDTTMDGSVASNVRASIGDNLDRDSEGIEESDIQPQEHVLPETSGDAGIMRSLKPVELNAPTSIGDNLDRDSNITEGSDLHS
jgi:hypothetical protein